MLLAVLVLSRIHQKQKTRNSAREKVRNIKFRDPQVEEFRPNSKRYKKAVLLTCAAAIFSATLSVIIQFVYLPLGVDGALYSYPAFSLSRGGDPGESQLTVEKLENIEGVKPTWGYDVSRTVRVLPMRPLYNLLKIAVACNLWSKISQIQNKYNWK